MKRAALNALILAIVLAFTLACRGATAGMGADSSQIPSFNVRDLDGQMISSADLKGKVGVINFWATWCPPCRKEIPDFVAAYNAHKSEGLVIIGLSVDELSPAELRAFVRGKGITYPVALASEAIIRAFDPGGYIPTTFIIDKKGRIRHKQVGGMDLDNLEDWFSKLSKEK